LALQGIPSRRSQLFSSCGGVCDQRRIGTTLLVADPVTKLHQVVFYVKLLFVALGVIQHITDDRTASSGHSFTDV
jgi:hypothetical protein